MSDFVVGDATMQETLQAVAQFALDALPRADMAGITMLLEGGPRTAVFTDKAAPEIDATQYETGMGPCLDAFRHNAIYRIEDLDQDSQWPAFSEAAASHGVRSVLSVPLVARHQGLGALNLYSRRPAAFPDGDVETGIAFATQAAVVLATCLAHWDAQALQKDLDAATASSATIEQAKGILMRVQGCGPDEALQMLLQASRRENRTVPEVAEELVASNGEKRESEANRR